MTKEGLQNISTIFFAGIGGIGMSALARYFLEQKKVVYGYDRMQTSITENLEEKGAVITYKEDVSSLKEKFDLVVYTPAIPRNHPMLIWLEKQGAEILKRADVLGMITSDMETIAVAGSHGKTTVSSMITQLLSDSEKDPYAFLGGIALNFNSNYKSGDEWVVAEADEFDRSFLKLTPKISVITSIDTDHMDVYGTYDKLIHAFEEFVNRLPNDGVLIYQKGISKLQLPPLKTVISYAIADQKADVFVSKKSISDDGMQHFNLSFKGKEIKGFKMPATGMHNLENALAAITVGLICGIDEHHLKEKLEHFKGVHRRFEYVMQNDHHIFIDDYAHHPSELEALLNAVREIFPERHITIVFQPHLYSRTRDLAEAFGKSLSVADEVILLDIYPAREAPINGVEAAIIGEHIKHKNWQVVSKEMLPEKINLKPIDLLITAGAGDIDQMVQPLKEILELKNKNLIADAN